MVLLGGFILALQYCTILPIALGSHPGSQYDRMKGGRLCARGQNL